MSCSVENNLFTDSSSLNECNQLLDGFLCAAFHCGIDVWRFVDFCDKGRISKNLVSSYKEFRSADCVDGGNVRFSAPKTMCMQNPIPREPPKIDSAKVQSLLHFLNVFFLRFWAYGELKSIWNF